eukprot:UN20195
MVTQKDIERQFSIEIQHLGRKILNFKGPKHKTTRQKLRKRSDRLKELLQSYRREKFQGNYVLNESPTVVKMWCKALGDEYADIGAELEDCEVTGSMMFEVKDSHLQELGMNKCFKAEDD